jgi:hypothetical protein
MLPQSLDGLLIYCVNLQWDLYDTLDWDDSWDGEDREAEDRWFEDDE